jgi:ubiquinone/menaquinone biosynthesis C-methylase UbiE
MQTSLLAYSIARTLTYATEYRLFNLIGGLAPGSATPEEAKTSPAETLKIRRDLVEFLNEDSKNISEGVYPIEVLKPEPLVKHLKRLPQIFWDGVGLYRRRKSGSVYDFNEQAKELAEDLPRYYKRNFHFQTNGYLAEKSAELYEHQVEMLFAGTADPMRRLCIPPMKKWAQSQTAPRIEPSGRSLKILEIAAGAGTTTKFVRQTFPKAKITVSDLSYPYLKHAQKKLKDYSGIDFIQADGSQLPFRDNEFDMVYSVFLFHELPEATRKQVFAEMRRVLKPNGICSIVDSIQIGDWEGIDKLLLSFPANFHEPFYSNYINSPLNSLMSESGFTEVQSKRGFLSKSVSGIKLNS